MRLSLLPRALVALVAAGLATPAIASASHIQGGSIDAKITADGHLRGKVTFLTANPCMSAIGDPAMEMPSLSAKNPGNLTRSIPLSGTYTRCLPNGSTATGTYDVDIATRWGAAPDGAYTLAATASARVSGILNGGSSVATFNARVTKAGSAASSSPVLNSGVATVVAKNYAYKQNLNGVDPDGGSVTYTSRAGTPGGPTTDYVTIGADGLVSMTAAQTNAFSDGDPFSYLVRIADSNGDYSERDVLLAVTANNAPPSIHGLPSSGIDATAGAGPQVVNFTADDPNVSQTVELTLAAGAPTWVTLNAPPGNPANASLTVDPPASVPAGVYAFNLDGVDSHSSAPLFASESVQVTVANARPDTALGSAPSSVTNSTTADFSFSSDESGVTYECRLDGSAWSGCASPTSYTSLADGQHTVEVRAIDAAQQADASPAGYSWTVDASVPGAPTLTATPEGDVTTTTARFAWTGEGAGSFECSVDGGAFTQCGSPLTLSGVARGRHSFAVREVDAAGNVGATRSVGWTVGDASSNPAPTEPTVPSPAAPTVEVTTGANASVAVQGDTAAVGCRVRGVTLSSCAADVYAHDTGGEPGMDVTAQSSASRRVLIGRGRARARTGDATRLAVDVKLNAIGRRLIAEHLTGLRVVLQIEARTVQGLKLNDRASAKLVPQQQLVIPAKGLFASGRSAITGAGRQLVERLGGRLGTVKSVTCVGHTDSIGTSRANQRLGYARAKAVCAMLERHGASGEMVVRSAGESQPRATNMTKAGRALNRRVEIVVRYR